MFLFLFPSFLLFPSFFLPPSSLPPLSRARRLSPHPMRDYRCIVRHDARAHWRCSGPRPGSIVLSLAFTYAIPLPLQPPCVIGNGVPARSNIKTTGVFLTFFDPVMSNPYYWYSPPPASYYQLPLPSHHVNYVYNVAAPRGLIDDRHGMLPAPGINLNYPLPASHQPPPAPRPSYVSAAVNFPVHQPDSALPHTLAHHLSATIYPTIEVKKYSTAALDPSRHFLTVYEYPLNGQSVIWDYELGYVHLTGIWKAAIHHLENDLPKSNSKADIVKLLESTPRQHQAKIKRIRGGFLKIQGTWLPYSLCRILARRFCYHIRYQLIPVFDASFPAECFLPTDPGYGELKLDELEPKVEPKRAPKMAPVSHPPASLPASLPAPKTPPQAILAPSSSPGDRLVRFRHHGSDLSYNEVVDIVNASKCLQSLSQSAQTSPISYDGAPSSLRDYVTGPENGISSILLAANLSNRPNEALGLPPKLEPRRASVKINDLLS